MYMSTPLLDQARGTGFVPIADALATAISRGELPPGSQLPAISALARQYGTTAITVRRALRALEDRGLVRVEHGVGTFVADWIGQFEIGGLASFSAEISGQDRRLETRLLERQAGIRYPEAAVALGVSPNASLYRLARLRIVNGIPLVFQHSYVVASLGKLLDAYTPRQSLYDLLRTATRRAPFAADETLRATRLTGVLARLLEQSEGGAAWHSRRTTFDAAGSPLIYDEAWFAGDLVELHVERRAGQSRLQLRITGID
jgi:GntR family transcriptional regulator